MKWTVLATLAALMGYLWFMGKVSMARKTFGIQAPATTGDPAFERYFRVQQNTMEQLVLFLPALWIFGSFVSDTGAGLLGLAWTGARIHYALSYYESPAKRGPGALASLLIAVILLVFGTLGAVLR